ncbi:MAG: stage III sporulation protein AD [Clostridia bacterium]|nr:stage III sporulation protein AD [Clostridia bacterium]
MEIAKICLIGVVASLLALSLRQYKPDVALLLSLTAGVILLLYTVGYVTEAFSLFQELIDGTGIDRGVIGAVLKIVGIGYITEFSSSVCEDSGNKSIADKIQFGGKVLIMVISLPLLRSVISIIVGLVQ